MYKFDILFMIWYIIFWQSSFILFDTLPYHLTLHTARWECSFDVFTIIAVHFVIITAAKKINDNRLIKKVSKYRNLFILLASGHS